MLTFSLQSGSNGNAIYVEAGDVRLLFDAGISGKTAESRLGIHGREIRGIDGLLISHYHNDHVGCAGVFNRKYGLPIYATRKTLAAARNRIEPVGETRPFRAGETICFGKVQVHTLPTPHDGVDGVAFVVEHEHNRLGILTDLGHPFTALQKVLSTLDACYLESNYDPEMLSNGPYPWHLQQRIRGSGGHLANSEAAQLLAKACKRMKWVALAHLSEMNNDPDLALDTHRRQVGRHLPLLLASRYAASDLLQVGPGNGNGEGLLF